jgi:hypothetical protein
MEEGGAARRQVLMSGRRPFVAAAAAAATLLLAPAANAAAGQWQYWWGQVTFVKNGVTLSSEVPTDPATTHSALVTSKSTWGDQTISVATTTLQQLRVGSPPNPWEVGWVMFHFRDLHDYYYFILKTNGFELGKKQGSDAQIFLVTGDAPKLAVGTRYQLGIQVQGARIRVSVNGAQVLDYTDPNPLPAGSIGLYEEDSTVHFDSLSVGP